MRTRIINGKAIAESICKEIASEVQQLTAIHGRAPGLGLVMVGDRKDSALYVKHKQCACEKVNIQSWNYFFDYSVRQTDLMNKIEELNRDPKVDGILIQLPLPTQMPSDILLNCIEPSKDVDGLHPFNFGECAMRDRYPFLIPCTAKGIMRLLEADDVVIEGKTAVVLGRSNLVGNPISMLLRKKDATVIQCHSKTRDLERYVKQADILVVACGEPNLVRGSWIHEGAIVIDVGINFVPDAQGFVNSQCHTQSTLVGDVCFKEALGVAAAITPVPGGVGPMTIAMLLENVVAAYKKHNNVL